MNVLIIGAGAREHAFAWKISQSKKLNQLFIAPGNPGTGQLGENLPISETDFESLKKAVLEHNIQLVIVGPELPLVNGIRDYFASEKQLSEIQIIAPSAEASMLEGSKNFAKTFMLKHGIPTAKYLTIDSNTIETGFDFLEKLSAPYVLKADGLAAGKGVSIISDLSEAKSELRDMLFNAKFGAASQSVVIEEFLKGIELSVFVLTDGLSYKILPSAKDYKRIGEGDTGENTGGMGALSPVPFADELFMKKVEEKIVVPTIEGLKKDHILYQGFIFIGIIKVNNEPYVIEYNCRMGDPETEVVLPLLDCDLIELMQAAASQKLSKFELNISKKSAATVMLVSDGYPGNYRKGIKINLSEAGNSCLLFHAGTSIEENQLLTNGGRVLAVTAVGERLSETLSEAMDVANKIRFEGKYFRSDIGKDVLN